MNKKLRLFLTLALVGSPLAAAEVGVKSLSGPPEEFAANHLPSAQKIGVPSNILLIDRPKVAQDGRVALPPGGTNTNFTTSAGVGFSVVQATTVYPYFAPATFTGPNGSRYYFDGSNISCNYGFCDEFAADIQMEPFANSAGGVAIFSISGGEVLTDGTWNLAVPNPAPLPVSGLAPEIETLLTFDDNVVIVGPDPEPCATSLIICPTLPQYELVDGAAPTLRISFANETLRAAGGDSGINLRSLRLTITDTRTRKAIHEEDLSLGRLAGLPADDVGANLLQLPSLPAGDYSVRLDVRGIVPGVGPIERTALYFLPILPRGYEVKGGVDTKVLDADRLELRLAIDVPGKDTPHVFAYAEVWSGDGNTPVAWISGMTQPEIDSSGSYYLPMVLDTRWLALAKVSGESLRLRNVRIQDADTFIPVDQKADLPFSARALPRSASLSQAELQLDDSLYFGKGDRTIRVADEEAWPSVGEPISSEEAAKITGDGGEPGQNFSNTGIFLVHGWCSNAVWPTWHFGRPGRVGGTEVFADFSASRSHDAFARQIRDQGAANFSDSFTIVAHSQGGAASTHLRAFYTSLLDLSNAPRRIQSMGTPYQGSTLMDYYLATGPLGWLIASIFGQCTQSFDLGTLGSQLWLSSVPTWAKSEVWFYRTGYRKASSFWEKLQFWRWRCNAASFVIPGWDDGVTADWQGFLSSGHNMGVSSSECHTAGMNHPAQTANSSRNDILDREGRPQNVNRALTATTSASSTYSPGCTGGLHCYYPSRVNDGDRNTTVGGYYSWCNNNGQPMPQWVQLQWSTPITFSRVELYFSAGYVLTNFRIEYRTSSTGAWQTLTTVSGNSSTYRGPFFVPAGTATAQAIRVVALSGSVAQPGYARVNEIEVY